MGCRDVKHEADIYFLLSIVARDAARIHPRLADRVVDVVVEALEEGSWEEPVEVDRDTSRALMGSAAGRYLVDCLYDNIDVSAGAWDPVSDPVDDF